MNIPLTLSRIGEMEYTFVYQPEHAEGWSLSYGSHEYHGYTIESCVDQAVRSHTTMTKTKAEVQDALEKTVARLNQRNTDLNLRITLGADEWVIEDTHEFPVPLIRIAYETGLFDALDGLRVAAVNWNLTFY